MGFGPHQSRLQSLSRQYRDKDMDIETPMSHESTYEKHLTPEVDRRVSELLLSFELSEKSRGTFTSL